jgi:serine/threonine protein kinase
MKLNKIHNDKLEIFKIDDFTCEVSSDKPAGSFGEVTRAVINKGNIPVVLKKYKENVMNTILTKDIIKEIIILQHLNQYPETNTAKLYGICIEFDLKTRNRYCYLVLESLETDLHRISIKYKNDKTKSEGRFNPLQYKIIFYKCLKALNAIHSLGFLHNDIKLANIMLHGTDIKFIDFGLSKYLGLYPLFHQVNIYDTTDMIKAPEARISFSSDIFSLASTMIHLVSRTYMKIRCDYEDMDIYDKKNNQSYSGYLSLDRTFGQDGFNLLCNLLNSDSKNRYCANKALLHHYFNEIRDIEKADNLEIDRTVVGLLGGSPISGLQNIIRYTPENFAQKNLEL